MLPVHAFVPCFILFVNIFELPEQAVINGTVLGIGPELSFNRNIVFDIVIGFDVSQCHTGQQRHAASAGLLGITNLINLPVGHIGKNLAPNVTLSSTADHIKLLNRGVQFFQCFHRPARVEGDSFKDRPDDMLAGMIETDIEQSGAHISIIQRATFAKHPWRKYEPFGAWFNGFCQLIQHLLNFRDIPLFLQLRFVIQDFSFQPFQAESGCFLMGDTQIKFLRISAADAASVMR